MGHRGPDGQGTLSDEQRNITLEHCRLAIIDPENTEADQPYTDPSGRWVIVYNGEIFNYKELRARLERRGARFRTNSDTEVLLQAYIFDGVAAFEQLRGMFAFLIWDRESGDLVAARDQIGVKPLYYTATADGVFAAASELRTLIGHPGCGLASIRTPWSSTWPSATPPTTRRSWTACTSYLPVTCCASAMARWRSGSIGIRCPPSESRPTEPCRSCPSCSSVRLPTRSSAMFP